MSDSDIFDSPKPRRSNAWVWLVLILVSVGALGLCALIVVAAVLIRRSPTAMPALPSVASASRVVFANDNSCQVTIPGDWSKTEGDPRRKVQIFVGDGARERCLMVFNEPKMDFDDVDLAKYADIASNVIVGGLQNVRRSPPIERRLQGKRVLEYRIDGTLNHLKLVYWHTTVEGRDHYFQVVTWTINSQARQNGARLRDIAHTFQETPKTGNIPPAEVP